jgi:hypothetical protein
MGLRRQPLRFGLPIAPAEPMSNSQSVVLHNISYERDQKLWKNCFLN